MRTVKGQSWAAGENCVRAAVSWELETVLQEINRILGEEKDPERRAVLLVQRKRFEAIRKVSTVSDRNRPVPAALEVIGDVGGRPADRKRRRFSIDEADQ